MGHPQDGDDAAEAVVAFDTADDVVVDAAAVGAGVVSLGGPEQDRVVAALDDVLHGRLPLGAALRTLLRDAADNDSRRRLKDALIGVVVLRRRLAWRAARRHDHASLPSATLLQQFLDDDDDGPWPSDRLEALGVRRSCPDWLVRALVDSLGLDDAEAFLDDANRPGPVTLRVNTRRTDRPGLIAALATDGIVATANPSTPWAVDVVGHANLMGSAAFRAGLFEVQDASSQQVALACEARPGDVVVDLCAGRGGKTLALAAMMQDRGRLIVHDVDERASADRRGRVRRLGLGCVEETPLAELAGRADVVLVDAPCSSVGVLRRSPELRWRLQPADVAALRPTQEALLQQAASLARPGGRVVYATCSVLRSENDDVADTAPPALESESRRLLLPHRDGGDGFFIAAWRCR